MRLIDADALWLEILKEEDIIHAIFEHEEEKGDIHYHRMNEIVRIKGIIAHMPTIQETTEKEHGI